VYPKVSGLAGSENCVQKHYSNLWLVH